MERYLSSGLPAVLGGFGVPFLVLGFWRRVKEGGGKLFFTTMYVYRNATLS